MSNTFAKLGMLACCAVMLLPVAIFIAAGGSLSGLSRSLVAFAPLVLCLAAHVLMFKLMGKSCHAAENKSSDKNVFEGTSGIPVVAASNRAPVEA